MVFRECVWLDSGIPGCGCWNDLKEIEGETVSHVKTGQEGEKEKNIPEVQLQYLCMLPLADLRNWPSLGESVSWLDDAESCRGV